MFIATGCGPERPGARTRSRLPAATPGRRAHQRAHDPARHLGRDPARDHAAERRADGGAHLGAPMSPRATWVGARPAIMRPSGELMAAPIAASAPPAKSSGDGVFV